MQIGGGGNQGYVDASARTDGTFTLPPNSVVYSGSSANNYIKGNFVVTTGSTLSVGYAGSEQVLSCSNNLTFQAGSTNIADVNKTATTTNCDLINVTGTNNYGGTLMIHTNGTVAYVVGDAFKLFNAAHYTGNFASVVDPSGITWSFNPATGVATVTGLPPTVNTNPATANFQGVFSSGALHFTWAADHQGWQLYTNAVGLTAASSWFPVAGSSNVVTETITINPANPNVFFQLRYP